MGHEHSRYLGVAGLDVRQEGQEFVGPETAIDEYGVNRELACNFPGSLGRVGVEHPVAFALQHPGEDISLEGVTA